MMVFSLQKVRIKGITKQQATLVVPHRMRILDTRNYMCFQTQLWYNF
jgi:hypothetical protein